MLVVKGTAANPASSYSGLQGFSSNGAGEPYITAEFSSEYFGSDSEIDFAIGNKLVSNRNKTKSRTRRAVSQGKISSLCFVVK